MQNACQDDRCGDWMRGGGGMTHPHPAPRDRGQSDRTLPSPQGQLIGRGRECPAFWAGAGNGYQGAGTCTWTECRMQNVECLHSHPLQLTAQGILDPNTQLFHVLCQIGRAHFPAVLRLPAGRSLPTWPWSRSYGDCRQGARGMTKTDQGRPEISRNMPQYPGRVGSC